jgi:nucleobase:cation symporter-1, NCS1 family
VGALLAMGGAWSAPGQGPFPVGGLIPALKPLDDDNGVVGFAVALVLCYALTIVSAPTDRTARHVSRAARHATRSAGLTH